MPIIERSKSSEHEVLEPKKSETSLDKVESDDCYEMHSKDKTLSKILKTTEFDTLAHDKPTAVQALPTDQKVEDKKSIETVESEEFTEVKGHKKKFKNKKSKNVDDEIEKALKSIENVTKKKSKEKVLKPKDEKKDTYVESVDLPATSSQKESEIETRKELVDYAQKVHTNIVTMDWNTLMAEEENILEPELSPISQPSIETDTSGETNIQVASEVTILPEITDLSNVRDKGEQFLDYKQESGTSDIVNVTTDSEEQNNNNKLLIATPSKDSSFNIVEEITRYEPILENVETRTIYLITHEEKKLPPIRTVKMFNTKSNSPGPEIPVETEYEESISEPIGTPEKAQNIVEKEVIISDTVEETSDNVEVSNLNVVSNIQSILNMPTETLTSDDVPNISEPDYVESEFDMPLLESANTNKMELTYTDSLNDENEGSMSLETIKHNIVNLCPNVEEFSESILEHAIFGSVQDRKRSAPRTHSIPYQELIEDIKTYSLNIDVDKMGYDYHQLMEEHNATSKIKETSPEKTQDVNIHRNEIAQTNVVNEENNKDKEPLKSVDTIPATYLEIIIGSQEITRDNLQNTTKYTSSTDEKVIDKTEITEEIENVINKEHTKPDISHFTLQDEIPRFNYHEISESEKQFAINVSNLPGINSKEEISTIPYEEAAVTPISQEAVNNENKLSNKFEDNLSDVKDNQIFMEPVISEPPQESNYIYHDISDAETKYPSLLELESQQQSQPTLDESTVLDKLIEDNNKIQSPVLEQKRLNPIEVLISEVPKYDLHEIKLAEILFVSSIIHSKPEAKEASVIFEKDINDQSTPSDISSPIEIDTISTVTYTEATHYEGESRVHESLIYDKIESQNYHDINDAEHIYATISNAAAVQNQDNSSKDQIPAEVPIESLTNKEIEHNLESVQGDKIVNDAIDSSMIQADNTVIPIYEPLHYNYVDLQEAEIRLGRISTNISLMELNVQPVKVEENISIIDANKELIHSENFTKSSNFDVISENKGESFVTETNIEVKTCDESTEITQKTNTVCAPVPITLSETEIGIETDSTAAEHQEITGEDITDSAPIKIDDTVVTNENVVVITQSDTSSTNISLVTSIKESKQILDDVCLTKSDDETSQSVPADNITLSDKYDSYSDVTIKDTRDKPREGEILLSPEEIVEQTNNKKEDIPQEILSSLIPIVFGDITVVTKLSLERNADSKSLERENSETQIVNDSNQTRNVEKVVIESAVDDFVVVEDMKEIEMSHFEDISETFKNEDFNTDKSQSEELDFEHSFEVIEVEKDIPAEINNPAEETMENIAEVLIPNPAVHNVENVPHEEHFEISTSTVVVPSEKDLISMKNEPEETERQRSQGVPETISAELVKADISPSSSVKNLNVDDTHGDPSNASSTDSYINLDTEDSTNVLISNQSILHKKITNIRLEKSPIHSLHDLLPEIDSIPEFKPSFSNTVLNSKLSADAPEFTPSYMYQTTDNSITKCALVDTNKLLLSDNKEIVQTGHPDSAPVTYSSIVTSKKETTVPVSAGKADEGHGNEKTKICDVVESNEASFDTKTKRNKKKKKKEDKKESIETGPALSELNIKSVSVPDDFIPQIEPECPENVWVRDDGKSYAKVLAAGLTYTEHKESLPPTLQESEVKIISDVSRAENIESQSKDDESAETIDTSDNYEVVGSWAKIVASNRPSPERTQKNIIHPIETPHTTRAPIILVDDSDSDHHKPEVEVDAEGFIRVDRNRRSRSRSRDNRSASVSKTTSNVHSREKSENRFIALTSTLKPDDGDSIHSSHSDEEKTKERKDQEVKDQTKRGRKGRTSKSKDKEVKPKAVLLAPSTSDEEKQPIKKDKKKRSSKSKEKTISQPAVESIQTLQEIKEAQPVTEKQDSPVQLSSDTAIEQKRKTKKKKKEKTVVVSADTPSPLENTSSEQESIKSNTSISSAKCPETPISTPESLETPIKDRVYSEAQYWKIDPTTIDEISNLSEILTVEIDQSTKTPYEQIIIKEQEELQTEELKEQISTLQDNLYRRPEDENLASLEPKDTSIIEEQRISDEQSLENKMADLQREIEEMLLPENDASVTSDETPRELADTQTSLDDHHDETFENITPSLASPEPEDIPQTNICVLEKSSPIINLSENIMETRTYIHTNLEESKLSTSADDNMDSSPFNIQKLDSEHIGGVDSPTVNISSNVITNNLMNIKLDTFWIGKAATDDAEKILIEQNESTLDTPAPFKQESQNYDLLTESMHSQDKNMTEKVIEYEPFWPEKHLYHDAECNYFLYLAKKPNEHVITNTEIEITDKKDKDKDPGGGSGHSSEMDEPRESCGSPFDSNYISMDLPGGVCSWKDQSSYLSLETPCDSLTVELSEDTPRVRNDIPEDKLTNLSLEPVASPPPVQEPSPVQAGNRTTAKDELSNNLEKLLEEVKIVQAQLSDLPNETLDAMEAGLMEGIAVLVKCEEAAILLEQKIMEYEHETEVQVLLKELIIMKARITKLLIQARQGLQTIKDARIEIENQSKQFEEQKKQIAKLDSWLDAINTELNESTKQDALHEENIARYIEIYERYIREYEEYEIILNSITVISHYESSQTIQVKALREALEKSRHLVITEIERLRQILINIKFTPEVLEEEISQTDRTIDSTSMPEEIASPRESQVVKDDEPVKQTSQIVVVPESESSLETEEEVVQTKIHDSDAKVKEHKTTVAVDTQTGKSLISDVPSLHDKSVICQPEVVETHDVSITCAPPQEVEVQTSEQEPPDAELLENIQVKQTISDGHETIVISSRPVVREQPLNEASLLVDADYRDDCLRKKTELNITHSLPQSFETVMVEPDETTTEVVVDADGTKRIIVKKVRRTLVTRQQMVQLSEEGIPQEQSYQQITLKEGAGSASTVLDDGAVQNVKFQSYEGQVMSGLPGREMTVHEYTSKPEMVINLEKGMSSDQIFELAEGELQPNIQTSSSSVTAVVEQITKRVVKTKRRIIRRVVIIDGKEHMTDEIIEEPDDIEVFEEQIPRIAINIRDNKTPAIEEDIDDNSKKPPPKPESSQDEERYENVKDTSQDPKPGDSKDFTGQDIQISMMPDDADHETTSHQFIQRYEVEEPDQEPQRYIIDQLHSQDKNILLPSGEQITQLETSCTRSSTVTKLVTRKITRTRKRIIKHIQIIDGKEHVTEEVIEEPEDVEIIEDEPVISQTTSNQDIKMQKVKVIRQVQIIDGKEYVTEKVIEEGDKLDTVEPLSVSEVDIDYITRKEHEPRQTSSPQRDVIEETEGVEFIKEPIVTQHTASSQDIKIKQIIRQVQTIDGKEYVTEKIIKEGDKIDTVEPINISESNIDYTAPKVHELRQKLSPETYIVKEPEVEEKPIITHISSEDINIERVVSQVQVKDGKEYVTEKVVEKDDKIDIVKPLIVSEVNTDDNVPKKHETILTSTSHSEIVKEPEGVEFATGGSMTTHTLTSGVDIQQEKVIRKVQTIDGKDTVTEKVFEEDDKIDPVKPLSITEINVEPELTQSLSPKITATDRTKTQKDKFDNIVEITKSLISSEIDHNIPTKPMIETDLTKVNLTEPKDGENIEEKSSTVLSPQKEKEEEIIAVVDTHNITSDDKIGSIPSVSNEKYDTVTNKTTTEITRTRKRIIKHIQIINGKEHVTEEIIEEPVEIKTILTEPKTYTIQEEGVKTKHIKIVRNVQIIDGKEHITEQILEDAGDEYVPESSVKAEIDLKIEQLTKPNKEVKPHDGKDKSVKQKETFDSTDKQQGSHPIDFTKVFIEDQIRHSSMPQELISRDKAQRQEKDAKVEVQPHSVLRDSDQVTVPTDITTTYEEAKYIPGDYQHVQEQLTIRDKKDLTTIGDQSLHISEQAPLVPTNEPVLLPPEEDMVVADDVKTQMPESVIKSEEPLIEDNLDKPKETPNLNTSVLNILPSPSVEKRADTQTNNLIDVTKSLLSSEIDQNNLPKMSQKKFEEVDEKSTEHFVSTSEILLPSESTEVETKAIITTEDITEEERDAPEHEQNVVTPNVDRVNPEVSQSDQYIDIKTTEIPMLTSEKSISLLDATKSFIGLEIDHSSSQQKVNKLKKEELDTNVSKEDVVVKKVETEIVEKLDDKIQQSTKEDQGPLTQKLEPKPLESPELISNAKPLQETIQNQDLQKSKEVRQDVSPMTEQKPHLSEPFEIIYSTDIQESDVQAEDNEQEHVQKEKPKPLSDDLSKPTGLPDKNIVIDEIKKGRESEPTPDLHYSPKEKAGLDIDMTKTLMESESYHTSQLLHSPKGELQPRIELKAESESKSKEPFENTDRITTGKESKEAVEIAATVEQVSSEPDKDRTKDTPPKPKIAEDIEQENKVGHMIIDTSLTQSVVDVKQLHTDSIVTEFDRSTQPASPEISYITHFEQNIPLSSDSNVFDQPNASKGMLEQSTLPALIDTKDVSTFIDLERHDTSLRLLPKADKEPTTNEAKDSVAGKVSQTVDITMSLEKTDIKADTAPSIKLDIKVEDFESEIPNIVKKDINVELPLNVKITKETPEKQEVHKETPVTAPISEHLTSDAGTPKENDRPRKKARKNKKQKPASDRSDSLKTEMQIETDKTVEDTLSSSLSHYVDLPVSPHVESPKPTDSILQANILQETLSLSSEVTPVELETVSDDKGYEPEDVSLCPTPSPDKKKRHKKHKTQRLSEDTTYPKWGTTDEDTPVSSVSEKPIVEKEDEKHSIESKSPEMVEPQPIVRSDLSQEITTTSPKEDSYHTISEGSDVSTVKIVEECVTRTPEMAHSEIATTITYTVPVVEEIATQEYSVQTSPDVTELTDVDPDQNYKIPIVETTDSELQTSPKPVDDSFVQTLIKEEKEECTQTVLDTVDVQDSEIQTSRMDTPVTISQSEVMTQVIPEDMMYLEEKYSQTSSPLTDQQRVPEEENIPPVVESRDIQTSPIFETRQEEKATEIIVETKDTDIQTILPENIDQETSTTPLQSKDVAEISIQTPVVSQVNVFTQFEDEGPKPIVQPDISIKLTEEDSIKQEVITSDISQQTSPRLEEPLASSTQQQPQDILKVDNIQQTSPRPDIKVHEEEETNKTEIISFDKTQQTSPRIDSENIVTNVSREINIVDNSQQTSPRLFSDDSISTSTDEPYEIHLKAQISIPQATDDFINNERQMLESPQSIIGDKSKQKKRRSRKKAESPLQSPGSLSDPINAELSLSVTPTSDDISSKETSSIDEGISQIVSPLVPTSHLVTQPKLTYSDVVQRSKSKSPSPSKTIILPRKSEKAKLIDTVEKRTQSITEPRKNVSEESMAVALIEPSMEQSYDLVVNKELDELKKAIEIKDRTKIEKSVVIVIETISIWLEEIQYKIQVETVTGTKLSDKTERLKELQNYVTSIKEIIYVTEVSEEIVTLIETLTRQVDAVNNLSNQSSMKVKEVEKEWTKFLHDTDNLSQSVEKVKSRLDDMIILELSVQQKLDELDKVELENIDNTDVVRKLFRRFRSIVEANPKRECPSKLYTCDEDTKQIENSINSERDRLMQLMSLAEEYEQTLQDFGQITDVAEALLDGKIIVSDLDHLHEEIQKHRKFFVNLSHCRAILESLEDNLDSETRAKYSSLHNSLHERATKIIDRAASRAQQMTLAASRWSILDHCMKEEQQWLRVAHQRIPDLTNVTSIDHEQYINLYQSISLDVTHHYAKMLRLLSITESLQNLIVCSGLESQCSTALHTLLTLQDDIDSKLARLRAFKENWITYELLINRVESWMNLANRELENITPENITTTANLRKFWELKAQHEVNHNLKNESGIQFEKALEILPTSDEMVQRQFFSKVEEKWRSLATRFNDLHATAIQNISDRGVSSGEKLHILEEEIRELRSALDGLKGVIKSEDELNLYIERLQVMTGRMDRIQNELGRLSLLPTAESDRLSTLLNQSGTLDDQIGEELERSLILKEKIVQVQAGIVRCQKNQRRARLTLEECQAAERLGSDVVEQAAETCQRLLEDLANQWRDILTLRQALHTLPISLRVCVSPTGVERDISALQECHAEIEAACNDLCARLRAKVQLWRRFERQLELVQGAVREADYMVELLTVQGQVDYDRLLKATEKLETLSESLSRRSGELVGELRAAAAPLEASTEPAVAAQLKREMDDAAAAYDHTCRNLTQMCDKYQKAVELWRRYREAAGAVRAFADSQEGRLHALRPDDAPHAKQACLEQEARVAELRSLAAQVAAETGSRALQADADALARRLQLVAGAVQALADLGEARQLARAKAQHAKEKLCDMRQDLAPVHEDSEIVEDKLIALRDNLIALGKSEADIAPAKAELPDIDRDVSEEHSIVRILELWQAMFRDTFLHYHRLSTALVRSGDAATALKLWHEYLLDLQSFLSGSLPTDYENLTEHRRLCRVHRNLLTSQRSVLINENKETKNRELADKFDTLTNLHNETLARIVDRHDEVCSRIAAWDDYREIYTELLRWLKEIEREKEKLQLRYVHIKRIHKILTKIQNLFDRLPEGRKFAEKLSVYLKRVLVFTEETYGASVRMEYAGIVKRVDNLQASLDTWRDFLTRILGLIGEYENLTGDLHKLYSRTQDEIMSYSDDERLSRPQVKKAIEKYSESRKKIDKTENQIEALSVIQEQLKECLSPQDIRIVNQRVWQLRQQRADLEHQLSIIIHRLQERLEIYTIFDSRLSRFSEWMTTLESRLETSSSSSDVSALDPQDLIRRINSDIQAETALKEREFEWLADTGTSLVDLSKKDEKSYSKNTSKQLKDVQERWQRLQETGRSRIAKINELLETILQLEERLTEIRMKLHTIESKLSASVVIEHLTAKAVDEKFQDRDEIHKNIEDESSEVGETLNLCELVFNDPDVLKGNFDLRNLRTGVEIVDKKWKNICEMSEQRKSALKEVRKSAELANSLLPKAEKKLDSIEKRVEKVEIRKQRGETDDDSVSKAVIKDLDAMEEDVKRLEDAYSRIASARGIEMRGDGADHTARLRTAVRRWQQLKARIDAAGTDLQRQFVAAHGKAVVALAEADVRLTRALHLAPTPMDEAATFKELDLVEEEVRECEALVAEADRLEASLGGAGGSAALAEEYRTLLQDVTARLQMARAAVVGDVDSAVQVDTLKWETDAALQVDTLTSKETYRTELSAAVRETSDALEALRTALLYELKDDASGEELAAAAKDIAKAGAKPAQTLELAKHLSELLLTECDATEDEAMLQEVESLSLRYEDMLTQAKKRELQINNLRLPHSASYALTCEHESGKLTCPLCSERNWKQLDNDLWRLEQWLQFAEATDEARTEPPEQYDALEDAIQDHREFLLDLDSHKALVVSLNVVGAHVARHARSAALGAGARARLAAANARWDAACAAAAAWQARLQHALLHNRQFHDIVVELVGQLSAAERCVRGREPLRLRRPPDELRRDFRRFSELRDELAAAEPRVQALRDAAALLHGMDTHHVCRRLGELRLRLQSLRKLSAVYALKLGASLAQHPAAGSAVAAAAASVAPQLLEEEEEQISALNLPPLDDSEALRRFAEDGAGVEGAEGEEERAVGRVQRGLRFVCRVARASLPFQALLLLLLGAAALAPHAHSDCRAPPLALEPVLRYPDGPPPL